MHFDYFVMHPVHKGLDQFKTGKTNQNKKLQSSASDLCTKKLLHSVLKTFFFCKEQTERKEKKEMDLFAIK